MCQDVSRHVKTAFPLTKLQNELSRNDFWKGSFVSQVSQKHGMTWPWQFVSQKPGSSHHHRRRWGPDQTTSRWRTGRHLVAQEIVANAVGSRWQKVKQKKWNPTESNRIHQNPTESNRIQHPIPSQSHRLNKFKLGRVTRLPGKRFRMDSAWILRGFWQGMSRYKKRKKWGCIGSIRFLSVSCSAIRAVFARQGFHVFGVTVPDCGKQQRPKRGKCNGRVRAIGRRKKGEGALSLLLMIENWENQQKRREGTSSKVLPPKHATRVRLDATSCYNSGPVRWRGQSLQPETAKDRELPRQAGRVPSSQRCKPDLE